MMTKKLQKAVIPVIDTEDNLFPFTRCVPRELLPIGDFPLIQHIADEAIDSGVTEIVFVLFSSNKMIVDHFKDINKISDKKEDFKKRYLPISFSYLLQKKKSKDGYTILKAEKKMEGEPFAVSFPGTVFHGSKSSLSQIFNIFRTSEKPVVALKEVKEDEVAHSLIVDTEKIANRFYKIKKIHDSPDPSKTSSRLALAGRFILTSLVFDYLRKMGEDKNLSDALNSMIGSGKIVYGHHPDGSWFDCYDIPSYLKTNSFFMLEKSRFSNSLKNYFKEIV